MYRRSSILISLCAVGVCAGLAGRAEGQVFSARSGTASRLGRPIRSSLLDRMFAGRSLFSQRSCQQPCITFGSRSIGTNFLTDGTPYDPWLAGSFPDRYQNSSALYGTAALNAAARGGNFVSSNAANVQAPASYRLTMPSLATGVNELTPRPIGGGWTTDVIAPGATLPPVTLSSSPPGAEGGFAQAMWSANKAALGKAIETPPPAGPADLAMRVGDKSFKRGEYGLARDDYRRALARDDDDWRVRLALGLAEFARGRFSAASKAVAEGMRLGPSLDSETFNLRAAYGRAGDFEKHLARLEAAASKSPTDAGLWLLVGYVRYFSGDRAGGVAAMEKYSAMAGADPQVTAFINSLTR